MAKFVEDPIFAIFGGLGDESFARAKNYIRAEFHSDDVPDGFTPGVHACVQPLIVGEDDDGNPAALGNSGTWSGLSYRSDDLAKKIGQCA
eukprot:627071-Pyramimonas_sp.AAC.1